jgi:gamma-glutamyl:cysteine ligase YbdK (ATP-grasp superfamily)
MHINLPFSNDDEFGRLHAAMRLILPILPALAASSPVIEGQITGILDTRVDVYRTNARRVPSVSGAVIPEPVFTRADYEQKLLQKIYDDLAPHDPEATLAHEWANARGCIARFERMAIEIRLLDLQECPRADIAIAAAVVGTLRRLVAETGARSSAQRSFGEQELVPLLTACTRDGDRARLDHPRYLEALGYPATGPARAGDVWQHLVSQLEGSEPGFDEFKPALDVILSEGCLARRILTALGPSPSRSRLETVYRGLATCLDAGEMFRARS